MENQIEIQARTYWDKTWKKFLEFNGMIAPSAKLVQNLFPAVPRNGLILDLGCGEGRNSLYLSQVGFNVIGLDLSFKAAIAMKNSFFEEDLKGYSIAGDSRILPFKNESFDGILAHHLFDYLDQVGFHKSIAETFRILKPGGVLLMTLDNFADANSDPNTVSKDDGSIVYIKGKQKGMLIRPYNEAELKALSQRGWQYIKDELTPKRSKIIMLKKCKTNC